ncbi:MAG: sigma-70 family RNA polymerase sigma factor [Planctomycetia bacterium]|nr:sigma-70 family RNA polymerase sigma factor [Planctomycetia bacterium]
MDDLANRLARGDREAFAELYDACADRVHHYLVVRLRCREDADEVLQETLVRLARAHKKLAEVDNLMAYVFKVARNEAARLAGRKARRQENEARFAAETLFVDGDDRDSRHREIAEVVALGLSGLDANHREVVELKIYAGLTFAEIAEVTGLPQGTIATRYRTALERLRLLLKKEMP